MCLEKLTAVVVLQFFQQVKRCFAVTAQTNLLLTRSRKNHCFRNLQLEFETLVFLAGSDTFVPGRNTNPFRLKTFFQTRKLTLSRLGNVCFSAGNKPFFQSFFVSPAAPQASQAPGFETNLFHLKTKLLNLSLKLAEPHPYSDHDCLLLTMISGNPTCSSVKTWAGYGKG